MPSSRRSGHVQEVSRFRTSALPSEIQRVAPSTTSAHECEWPREQLPKEIRELIVGAQRLRNDNLLVFFDC